MEIRQQLGPKKLGLREAQFKKGGQTGSHELGRLAVSTSALDAFALAY